MSAIILVRVIGHSQVNLGFSAHNKKTIVGWASDVGNLTLDSQVNIVSIVHLFDVYVSKIERVCVFVNYKLVHSQLFRGIIYLELNRFSWFQVTGDSPGWGISLCEADIPMKDASALVKQCEANLCFFVCSGCGVKVNFRNLQLWIIRNNLGSH